MFPSLAVGQPADREARKLRHILELLLLQPLRPTALLAPGPGHVLRVTRSIKAKVLEGQSLTYQKVLLFISKHPSIKPRFSDTNKLATQRFQSKVNTEVGRRVRALRPGQLSRAPGAGC